MKLFTHNMLTSNILKGVKSGFPLRIEASEVIVKEVDYNPDFLTRIVPRLDWGALKTAADQLGHGETLPAEVDAQNIPTEESFLRALHRALLEVEVVTGDLVCPETGRKFPVERGIPNMLLRIDEH